jgi:methionyl-tRNA formyltransferase
VSAGRLRVFVVTQDEPLYAPRYLRRVLGVLRHDVIGAAALAPAGPGGWGALVRQRFAMYGPIDFLRIGARFAARKATRLLPSRTGAEPHSVDEALRSAGVPRIPCRRVNDPAFVDLLRALEVDVLVSIAANQRFGAALLRAPRVVALNVHSSLLPKYRGLDGLFWALVHGEKEVGVTVHVMSERIDEGDIVAQEAIAVGEDDSLHVLYLKAMDVGARLLADAVDAHAAGRVVRRRNDPAAGSYFSWPTREAARAFRRRGRRFV